MLFFSRRLHFALKDLPDARGAASCGWQHQFPLPFHLS